jgi:6-phosphogluconolactonase (cycloisomerase 2 family)
MQGRISRTGFLLLTVITLLLFTFGCSGGGSRPAPATYAYTSELFQGNGETTLGQFQMQSNGMLTPLSPAAPVVAPYAISVAVDPSDRFLFATSNESNIISQFVIGEDGSLSPNIVPAITIDGSPSSISFTPNGRFAIVAASFGNTLTSYELSPAGSLTLTSTVNNGTGPPSVAIDPSGRFVYVGNVPDHTISEYAISAGGVLAPISANNTVPAGNLFQLAISPKGFLYSANYGPPSASPTVTEFEIASTGALVNVGNFPTGSAISNQGGGAEWIAFEPTGNYAYVANGLNGTVSQFIVNSGTGALLSNGADISLVGTPQQVVVSPNGKFVLATIGSSGVVSQFSIGQNGALVPNGSTSLGTFSDPYAIAFAQR